FAQGVTTASFGPGITVGTVTVNGPALASAPITISPNATAGPRAVAVTTGGEVVQLDNGFAVNAGTPAITVIDPNVGVPGALALSVTVIGQSTNFQSGVTVASFGPNISVGGAAEGAAGPVAVTSPTSFTASLTVNLTAPTGQRTVRVQTSGEVLTVTGGFTVTTSPDTTRPSVLTVSPAGSATGVALNPEI